MSEKKTSMIIRVLVAVPLVLLLIMTVFFPNWFLRALIYIIMMISQYEIVKAANIKVPNMNHHLPFIMIVLIPPIFYFFGWQYVVLTYGVAMFWLIVESVLNPRRDMETLMMGIFTLLYPSVFFTAFFGLSLYPNINIRIMLILIVLLGAMGTDTAAYFFGTAFGKHKLVPRISPNKSVEGAIAGYITGFILIMALGLFMQNIIGTDISLVHFVILGAVLPALVQVGDIVASLVKRYFGLKDFGHIFPEHGGVLDRFDSSTFVCPLVYIYFTLIYGNLIG